MALPKQKAPIYNFILPSTGKKYNFRPFLVKDNKNLMIAKESEDEEVMLNSLLSVIEDCVIDLDTKKITAFDAEYIFAQLRAKSVDEFSNLIVENFCTDTCKTEDNENFKIPMSLNISEIAVKFPEGIEKNIKLFDDVGVVLNYPTLTDISELKEQSDVFPLLKRCVEMIYDGEEIFPIKDTSDEELREFIEGLTQTQLGKLTAFFNDQPKLYHELKYSCPSCKKEHVIKLQGIASFF